MAEMTLCAFKSEKLRLLSECFINIQHDIILFLSLMMESVSVCRDSTVETAR